MAGFQRFEDIVAWQDGRALVKRIYAMSCVGEFSKDFGMRDQIRRAAVSVCSNIAEGFERRGNAEFIKFLWIAKGSAAEVSSQLYHLKDLEYISEEQFQETYASAKQVGFLIHRLIASIPDKKYVKTPSTSSTPSTPSTP